MTPPLVSLECSDADYSLVGEVLADALSPRVLMKMATTGRYVGSNDTGLLALLEAHLGPATLAKIVYAENYKGSFNVIATPDFDCFDGALVEVVSWRHCACNVRIALLNNHPAVDNSALWDQLAATYQRPGLHMLPAPVIALPHTP